MNNMSWKEIIELLQAYKNAVEEGNEEEISQICDTLPEEIKFWENDILIKV